MTFTRSVPIFRDQSIAKFERLTAVSSLTINFEIDFHEILLKRSVWITLYEGTEQGLFS